MIKKQKRRKPNERPEEESGGSPRMLVSMNCKRKRRKNARVLSPHHFRKVKHSDESVSSPEYLLISFRTKKSGLEFEKTSE